jgi:predicted esterase
MFIFSDYIEMRQKVGELFKEGKLAEAAQILEWGMSQFPDNLLANAYNLATCYAFLGKPENAIQTLQYGLDHGIWYGQWDFTADFWDSVKVLEGFQDIQLRSEACLAKAQKAAKPELTVVTPNGYDPVLNYPLFIALHGGGETVEIFKPQWTSPKLETGFIVAYPQSSRVVSMLGFSWMGEDQDRQEIGEAYQEVLGNYSVDTDQILMGGFSAGGHQTLTLLLDEQSLLPLRGFIVLCPPVPETYPPEDIARIVERGQRGLFLTTEMDTRVEDQRKMAAAMEAGGVPLQFEITPNVGHWYPPDFANKLDEAIDFIFQL